jgi:hypothetical protein
MIHPLDQDRPSAVVDHGDGAGPMIAFRLRLGGGDHFARRCQSDDLLLGQLRSGALDA